ncbi:MAG TPA: hypothetical protein VF519_15280 [Mycobacteriales bacterium]|jgi:hypothetical protein
MKGDRPTARQRLRYALDTALASGMSAVVAWLGLMTLGLIVLAGVAIAVFDVEIEGAKPGFFEGMWLSLQRTLDAGTGGGDVGWPFRLISLLVTLGGIFVVTALIGLTANAIDRRIEAVRRGRSLVIERGHTLILGWSSKLPTVISELAEANANQPRSSVVILAPRDQVEMEEAVRAWVPKGSRMRVVCRTGEAHDPEDLARVNPAHAKSVILLMGQEHGDAETVKALLSVLRTDPGLRRTAVVAELASEKLARALHAATDDRVITVVSTDVIARITAQVCRQPGLSTVYQEVLDFAGDEIYFGGRGQLAGLTFGQALVAFETSSVMGVRRPSGEVLLVPELSLPLTADDEVVCLSADDDTVVFSGVPDECAADALPRDRLPAWESQVERVLVIGWNEMAPSLAHELDHYAAPGSVLHVHADPARCDVVAALPALTLSNYALETTLGDTNDPDVYAKLFGGEPWHHVVVLCYHGIDAADADARALLALLQLRHEFAALPEAPTVVAEMRDPRDVELAPVSGIDDFIVSERLTSYVLAQLSENAALAPVFEELFGSNGCELAVYRASRLGLAGERRFLDVVRAARSRGDVAIGYRTGGRVTVNPPKSAVVAFGPDDDVIVVTR